MKMRGRPRYDLWKCSNKENEGRRGAKMMRKRDLEKDYLVEGRESLCESGQERETGMRENLLENEVGENQCKR